MRGFGWAKTRPVAACDDGRRHRIRRSAAFLVMLLTIAVASAGCVTSDRGGRSVTSTPRATPGATAPAASGTAGASTPAASGTPRATRTPTATLRATNRPTPTGTPTIEGLLAILATDEDPNARVDAVFALMQVDDPQVGPAIEAALSDEDVEVRQAAAAALAERGDTHAVKPLAAALTAETGTDPDSAFAIEAAQALAWLGGSGGVSALVALLRASSDDGRTAAVKALGAIGSPAVSAAQKLLADKDVDVRLAAVDALYGIGTPAVKALIAALKNSEVKVRSRAANRLGYLDDLSAESGLVAMLDDPGTGGGNSASIALARLYADAPTKLVHYLSSAKTVRVYYGLIFIGADETVDALASALLKIGDLEMARFFLNCGQEDLEQAARDWAPQHGYSVVTVPGVGSHGEWGSGLP